MYINLNNFLFQIFVLEHKIVCKFDIIFTFSEHPRDKILCFDICQVQYLNPLSVRIRAKISPSGSEAIIRIADANQDAATDNDMIPRL